jgi:ethylbenzene dioxygenase beta subunit
VTAILRAGDPLSVEVAEILNQEGYLLDHDRLDAWLDLLSKDISYRAYVCLARERAARTDFAADSLHYDETWSSLQLRIDRLATGMALAEDPPSRVRRFISNVQVTQQHDDEFDVRSYVLLTRIRHGATMPELLTCERHDGWRRGADSAWQLFCREIYLDQTTIAGPNLAVFL